MRTDCFTEESLLSAYEQAASAAQSNFEQFAESSKFFDFAASNLGGGLSISTTKRNVAFWCGPKCVLF